MSGSHVVHRFYCIEKDSERKGLLSGIKCFRIVFIFSFFSKKHWAREMPQGVRALATKSDNPCSIPGTHMVARETQRLQVFL